MGAKRPPRLGIIIIGSDYAGKTKKKKSTFKFVQGETEDIKVQIENYGYRR